MRTSFFPFLIAGLVVAATGCAGPAVVPLADHPGNVVLVGTELSVRLPIAGDAAGGDTRAWRATDYEGKTVREGNADDGVAHLGKLPVGYYEVRRGSATPVSAAVLAPLKVRPSVDSPICVDAAMAWFYKVEQMHAVANLCALAGARRVRDRLNWEQLEPAAGSFAPPGVYDASAAAQSAAGLAVLQVNHVLPGWAGENAKRFPLDLRDAYRFYRAMAERWRGSVTAFEPWNEADIEMFGGHTGCEMASLQKAAYLGIKAGNPDATACMNVFALSRPAPLEDVGANECTAYFDTFNLHHYANLDQYPATYAAFRRVAGGKPMWTTEFQIPVQWTGDPTARELSEETQKLQAERLTMSYATGLNEGPATMFYFVLPHYTEDKTQYGLLHKDLTPRPSFVALAAAGRLLADAKPIGKLNAGPAVTGYFFNARPDGVARVVLVVWSADGARDFELGVTPVAAFDHLGRAIETRATAVRIKHQPTYVVLPAGAASRFEVTPSLTVQPPANAVASPVVLQADMSGHDIHLSDSALRVSSQTPTTVRVFAYNFASVPAHGALDITCPRGWKVDAPQTLDIPPGDRKEIAVKIDCNGLTPDRLVTLKLAADMRGLGQSVLSFRVMPAPRIVPAASLVALPDAADVKRLVPDAAPGTKLAMQAGPIGVSVDATLTGSERWVYPRVDLRAAERAPAGTRQLRIRFKSIEGRADFRVLFVRSNGAIYVGATEFQPRPGESLDLFFDIATAAFGKTFSPADPDGRLLPEDISALKIGCNPIDPHVRFEFADLNWVK